MSLYSNLLSVLTPYANKINQIDGIKSDLNSNKHSITAVTDVAFSHEGLSNPDGINFIGNSNAFSTARYADKVNLNPSFVYNQVKGGVQCTGSGDFLFLDGTATGSTTFLIAYKDFTPNLPAGTYKTMIEVDIGESVISNNAQFVVTFYFNDSTNKPTTIYVGSETLTRDIVVDKDVRRIAVTGGVANGNVYTGYKMWFGIFPADVAIVNTGKTLADGEQYAYSISGDETTICSMQHQSTITQLANIKEYVDALDVDIDEKLTYITPERFGAKGDETNDDYNALTQCIAYAIANHVPIRGYGRYLVSSMIVIESDDLDVFFEKLITRSTIDAVIKVTGYRNRIKINNIYAYNGDCAGFILYGKTSHWSNFNTIILPYVFSRQSAIVVDSDDGAYSCENKFHTMYLRSMTADCVRLLKGFGENSFYGGGQIICPQGWAINVSTGGNKFYNFALEAQARSGIRLNNCECNTFYAFRIAELRGQKTESSGDTGTLLKFIGTAKYNVFECGDILNVVDIDVSEATKNEDITDLNIAYKDLYALNVIKGCGVRSNGYILENTAGYTTNYGDKIITLRNNLIVVPNGRMRYEVAENIDYTAYMKKPFATDFVIKANATIKLNASYCCIGFNRLVIDQTEAVVTIYDKNNAVIFNGNQLGSGKYLLECVCDAKNNRLNELTGNSTAMMYDGENDVWTVTKLS